MDLPTTLAQGGHLLPGARFPVAPRDTNHPTGSCGGRVGGGVGGSGRRNVIHRPHTAATVTRHAFPTPTALGALYDDRSLLCCRTDCGPVRGKGRRPIA